MRAECRPAFDFARVGHTIDIASHSATITPERGDLPTLRLASSEDLQAQEDTAVADFTVHEGETVTFVLESGGADGERGAPKADDRGTENTPRDGRVAQKAARDARHAEAPATPATTETADALFYETVAYWRRWLSQCTYKGRWREIIYRSALTLKLLTFAPTGGIVAAPTAALPEALGGERNWDYRYTWIRDAAFTVYGLMRAGFPQAFTHLSLISAASNLDRTLG